MSKILIENGTIVNENRRFVGYIIVDGERIVKIGEGEFREEGANSEFKGERIDATDRLVMPGVIDCHVHFREPGLTQKGDMLSESRAAIAGGVTSVMEMPNTTPATITLEKLEQKFELAAERMMTNHSFYLGATNDNIEEIKRLDPKRVCGVKLFVGASTGDMLVDNPESLSALFAESPILVAAHCESEAIIRRNSKSAKVRLGDDVEPYMHPSIRSAEACYRSTADTISLADRYGANLHVLHLTTARELNLFDSMSIERKRISSEVCVPHLWFSYEDYFTKGNLIKCNPAIKRGRDRDALRKALHSGKVDTIATDHAPHLLEEKQRSYWQSPSGMPTIEHSLPAVLEMSRLGVLNAEKAVEKMCHAPAIRYGIKDRGFLREGAYADIIVVNSYSPWTVSKENILHKCGWSPFEGEMFANRVEQTIVNGVVVYNDGKFEESFRGLALEFDR